MTEHVAVPEQDEESGAVATGNELTVKGKGGEIALPEYIDSLTFTVPKDAPQVELRGTKITKPYAFGKVDNDTDAAKVMGIKGWKLMDFVNEALQGASRSSAYQATLALYRPTKVSEDDIVERMVRDFIRLGVTEDAARAQVASMLSNK